MGLGLATVHSLGHLAGTFVYGSRKGRREATERVLHVDAVSFSFFSSFFLFFFFFLSFFPFSFLPFLISLVTIRGHTLESDCIS